MRHSPSKPHGLAHHVAALFRSPSANDMKPVELSMEQGINVLELVNPESLDLTNPDTGIPFSLEIENGNYP